MRCEAAAADEVGHFVFRSNDANGWAGFLPCLDEIVQVVQDAQVDGVAAVAVVDEVAVVTDADTGEDDRGG